MLPHYIYLDSKIIGTAVQIVTFFDNNIFNRGTTTILIKKYKHKSNKIIGGVFSEKNINYRFVSAGDLDALEKGVIFYPFNAQSNCRAVANRKLTHVFITHGESSKISSVKPIIRIYDYVITAGQAGIERYLKHKIFSQYDVDVGRIIPLGDTFIGRTGLSTDGLGESVVFYAPTWEGGIEQENYSSLAFVEIVSKYLMQASKCHQVNTIVIKPHPNTGHRLKEYRGFLLKIVKILRDNNLKVVMFKPHIQRNLLQFLQYKRLGIQFKRDLKNYRATIGFCDLSAVETQFLNEDISYYLFCSRNAQFLLNIGTYPRTHIINLSNGEKCLTLLSNGYYQALKQFFIEQKFASIELNQRIELLTQLITFKTGEVQ